MMEKEVVKIIKDLFEPVNESLEILQKIDKKLDIQASSKLRGQLEMLALLADSKKNDLTSFKICLGNLNESKEYYKSLTDQAIKEFNDVYGDHRLKFFLTSGPMGWLKFGRNAGQKPLLCFASILDYANLWCLSEAGAIICLIKLKYSSQVVEERERQLAGSFISVWDFIADQAFDLVALAEILRSDTPLHEAIALPRNSKKSGSLSDRLGAKMLSYVLGKDALYSLFNGYINFRSTTALKPDCSIFPELDDINCPRFFFGDDANKTAERELENSWRSFLGTSKQLNKKGAGDN